MAKMKKTKEQSNDIKETKYQAMFKNFWKNILERVSYVNANDVEVYQEIYKKLGELK